MNFKMHFMTCIKNQSNFPNKLVSVSKKTISNLEKEVMKLNIELENHKIEVKTLKQIDKNQFSTIQDINKVSHSCKCCDKFKV